MAQLSCVIYAESESDRRELSRALQATGHVDVAESLGSAEKLPAALGEARPDAVFAVLGDGAAQVFQALEAMPEPRPALIFAGPPAQSDWILRAMRLGAREYLPQRPSAENLAALVERLLLEPARAQKSERAAKIVGVLGAKGGVGATVVTSQLAASLQDSGRSCCVVDLNLRNGDVALHYDITPDYTLADVAKSSGGVDASFLRSIVQRHSSGVGVVAAPVCPEDAELVNARHVTRTLRLLQAHYDFLVVDLPRSWDDATLRVLDLLDELLFVVTLELPALSQARQQLELLERLGLAREKIHVVVNRFTKSPSVSEADARRFLGREIDAKLPNDYGLVSESIASGSPVADGARRSGLGASYRSLAEQLQIWCGVLSPEDSGRLGVASRIRNLFRRGQHGSD